MKISLSATSIIAAVFVTQAGAQQLYAEGEAAKELFESSDAEISTSHGGGIRLETKQISDDVSCDKVTNIEVSQEGEYTYENPFYDCDTKHGLFFS